MTEILSAVSPSVFSWSMLGHGSLAAFLLPLPEKGALWPTGCQTHPVRVAAVALVLTGLVDISSECCTGGPREGTYHPQVLLIESNVTIDTIQQTQDVASVLWVYRHNSWRVAWPTVILIFMKLVERLWHYHHKSLIKLNFVNNK